MGKKILLTALSLVICLTFICNPAVGRNEVPNSGATGNGTVTQSAGAAEVTMRDIADFLSEKDAHYPLSDEFIERYQQASGGYIDLAKKTAGMIVDKTKHEPNQKWHFFDSWLYPSIEDGTLTWDASAKTRVYTNLQCPELLLWIYEASGVDPAKVRTAKNVAEQGRAAGTRVATIAKNMRECVAWEDIENSLKDFTPSARVTLDATALSLTVGESSTVTATVVSPDAVGAATWTITQGEGLVSITPDGNTVTVNALAKGTAKIKVSYGDSLYAECTVTVKEPRDPSSETSVKYVIQEDLGTGKRTKTYTDSATLFETLKNAIDGDGIITSVDGFENIYGGGYGGSGDNAWYVGNVLKFGTTSVNGSLTLTLNAEVNQIIITGYVAASNCKIQVGDSTSTDWTDEENDNKTTTVTCSEMTETTKENIETGEASTIVIDFESASTITIANTNKKPLYITSIEFVLSLASAQ